MKTCGKIDKTCKMLSVDNRCRAVDDCVYQNETKQFNQSLRKYIRRCYDNIKPRSVRKI